MSEMQQKLLAIFGGGLALKKVSATVWEMSGKNGVTAISFRNTPAPYTWKFTVPNVRRLPYVPHPAQALLKAFGARPVALMDATFTAFAPELVAEIDRFVTATSALAEFLPLYVAAVVDPDLVDDTEPADEPPAPATPPDLPPPLNNVRQNPMLPHLPAPVVTPEPAPLPAVTPTPEPAVNFNQIAMSLISTLGDNTLKFHCMESGKYWEASIETGVESYHVSLWPVNDVYPIGKSMRKSPRLMLSWLESLTITTEPRLVPPVLPAAPAPAPATLPPTPAPEPPPVSTPTVVLPPEPYSDELHRQQVIAMLSDDTGRYPIKAFKAWLDNPENAPEPHHSSPLPAPAAPAPAPASTSDAKYRQRTFDMLEQIKGRTDKDYYVLIGATEGGIEKIFELRHAPGEQIAATSQILGAFNVQISRTLKTYPDFKLWFANALTSVGAPEIIPTFVALTPSPAEPVAAPVFPPSDAEWHIVTVSGNYGKQKVIDPLTHKEVSAYKISYTGAADVVIRRLYDGYCHDVTPKRASYRYVAFTNGCETLTHRDCFLVEISSKTLAEIVEVTRQYDRAKTYVWRDKKWWELPSQQNKEFALAPRMNFDPEPLHPPRPGKPQQKKEEPMSGLKAEKKEGLWWISGNTYPHREAIKAAGCRWNRPAQAWTYSGEHLPAALATLIEANKPAPAPSMPPELSKMIENALAADDARGAAARKPNLLDIFGGQITGKRLYDDPVSFIHLSGKNLVFAGQAVDSKTQAVSWYFSNASDEPSEFEPARLALKAQGCKWLPTSYQWHMEDTATVQAMNQLAESIPLDPYEDDIISRESSLLKIFGGKLIAKRLTDQGVVVMGENGCFARRLKNPDRWEFDLPAEPDRTKVEAALEREGATTWDGVWQFKTLYAVSRMNAVAEFIPFDTILTWTGMTRVHSQAKAAAQAAPVPQPEPTPVAPVIAPKPAPEPEPEPEPPLEKEPAIKVIAPPTMDDGKDDVVAAIRVARLSPPPPTAPVLPAPKAGHVAVKQAYVGELTGSVSGNVYCYGYAVHKGIAIYINLAGPKVAVEAIRAKLGKGEIVNCVSDDAPTQELTAGEKNTGKYKAYSTWMQEARFMSEILVHEDAVTPNYGGLSTAFIIRTDDAQATAKLKHHVKQLVKIPVFDQWGDYLYQSGQAAMLVQPCKCAGGIDMLAVTLDVDAWTRLITGGLAQQVIALPAA